MLLRAAQATGSCHAGVGALCLQISMQYSRSGPRDGATWRLERTRLMPAGHLPVLKVGDKCYSEHIAICRFIARQVLPRLGVPGLVAQ